MENRSDPKEKSPRKRRVLSPKEVAKIRLLTPKEMNEARRKGQEDRLACEREMMNVTFPDPGIRFR